MRLALGRAPGLTAQLLRGALAALQGAAPGTPVSAAGLPQLFRQCRSSLESLGLPPAASAALQAPDAGRIAADRRWVESEHINLIDAADPCYPPLLAQAAAAPVLLYVKGDGACLRTPQLAIVGSRNPTQPGERTARAFAGLLSAAGLPSPADWRPVSTPPVTRVPWRPTARPSRCSARVSMPFTRASTARWLRALPPAARW